MTGFLVGVVATLVLVGVAYWSATRPCPPPPVTCTGVSASWCPVCGDCCCPVNEVGETVSVRDPGYYGKDSPDCPLHAPDSPHGEVR